MMAEDVLQEADRIVASKQFDAQGVRDAQVGVGVPRQVLGVGPSIAFVVADTVFEWSRGVGSGVSNVALLGMDQLTARLKEYESAMSALRAEVSHLRKKHARTLARVASLEEEVERLKGERGEEGIVELRSLSRETAKQEILSLFAGGETIYMSEVAERLRLPDEQVVEICLALLEEGKLRSGDDVLRAG